MPTSYQGKSASQGDKERTFSQSADSNLKVPGANATVATILADKDGTVHSAAASDNIGDVTKRLHALRIGVLVVLSGDALTGILSERDIVSEIGARRGVVSLTMGEVWEVGESSLNHCLLLGKTKRYPPPLVRLLLVPDTSTPNVVKILREWGGGRQQDRQNHSVFDRPILDRNKQDRALFGFEVLA